MSTPTGWAPNPPDIAVIAAALDNTPLVVFEGFLGCGRDLNVSHSDLVTITRWMAVNGYSADDVAYAVEKPWKYTDELATAKAQS